MSGFSSYRLAFLSLTLLLFASLQVSHYHQPHHTNDSAAYSDTGSAAVESSHCLLCVSGANSDYVPDNAGFEYHSFSSVNPLKSDSKNPLLTQLYSKSGRSPPSFA